MIRLVLGLVLVLFNMNLFAQAKSDKWVFFRETDGIAVYSKFKEGSSIKEVKLITTVKTDVKTVAAFIVNVDSLKKWGYGCIQSDLLKKFGNRELYYYYAVDIPWPLDDRDVVINMKITQDTLKGITTIKSMNADGYLPERPDRTRIKYIRAKWVLSPVSMNKMQIDFTIAADLGADFPDWVVNRALSSSPVKSMQALKKKLE